VGDVPPFLSCPVSISEKMITVSPDAAPCWIIGAPFNSTPFDDMARLADSAAFKCNQYVRISNNHLNRHIAF